MSDWERVFRDACDEAGCAYDNEALLQAISDLKRSRGVAQQAVDCGEMVRVAKMAKAAAEMELGLAASPDFSPRDMLDAANAALSTVPSTHRAMLPGEAECDAWIASLSSTPRCTCAAIVNPHIPHARFCPLSSTSRDSASTYCALCDHEHQLHEDAQGFHHVVKGARVACPFPTESK